MPPLCMEIESTNVAIVSTSWSQKTHSSSQFTFLVRSPDLTGSTLRQHLQMETLSFDCNRRSHNLRQYVFSAVAVFNPIDSNLFWSPAFYPDLTVFTPFGCGIQTHTSSFLLEGSEICFMIVTSSSLKYTCKRDKFYEKLEISIKSQTHFGLPSSGLVEEVECGVARSHFPSQIFFIC